MPDYTDNYIYATIHDFKSNIARYIRKLEREEHRAVIVKRYNKPVGFFMAMDENEALQHQTWADKAREESEQKKRREKEERKRAEIESGKQILEHVEDRVYNSGLQGAAGEKAALKSGPDIAASGPGWEDDLFRIK